MNKIEIPVYCINLKKQTDRKKIMEEQFKKYNIQYKICNAIDSNYLIFNDNILTNTFEKRSGIYRISRNKKITFNIKSKKYFQITKTNGHIGCSLSHLYYIHQAYINNLNILIMCEDDISLEYMVKWKKSITEIIENAPNDWKIIKLHCSNINILNQFINKEQYIKIPKNSVIYWSTGFYIINKNGMEDLINKFYMSTSQVYNLFCDFPVADYLLHQIDGVYYYSVPLVKNNNLDYNFKSDITFADISLKEEIKGINFVKKYYS